MFWQPFGVSVLAESDVFGVDEIYVSSNQYRIWSLCIYDIYLFPCGMPTLKLPKRAENSTRLLVSFPMFAFPIMKCDGVKNMRKPRPHIFSSPWQAPSKNSQGFV
jgi:hypothetical protein